MKINISNEDYTRLSQINQITNKAESVDNLIEDICYKAISDYINIYADSKGNCIPYRCSLLPTNESINLYKKEHYDYDEKMLEGAVKNYIRKNTKTVYVLDDCIKHFTIKDGISGERQEYYAKVYEPSTDSITEVPLGLLVADERN